MNFVASNWKTSGAGMLSIVTGIAALTGVTVGGVAIPPDAALGLITSGVIGLLAKDGNVTGGTVKQ